MLETLSGLLNGFSGLMTVENLVATFLGAFLGTIVGVLPGLGPVATMAILLPITMGMSPTAGLVLLAGIFYGAQYGGSTTSILLSIPGEATSVITILDGYAMTKKNRAGAALTAAAIGSFIAGTMGYLALTFFSVPVAALAPKLGPPEYFAISVCGLIILANTSGGAFSKNMLMVLVGIMLSTVGIHYISGTTRFDFGYYRFGKGIDYVPVLIGLFGMAEVIQWILSKTELPATTFKLRLRDLYPTRTEARRMLAPMFRGGVIGFLVGLLPGPGAILATYASYAFEKKISKHPEEFGQGAIEGVAGPESANNSSMAGGLIMLLSLGLPFSGVTALLLGALQMQGLSPGPTFIREYPQVFWVFVASLFLGNLVMLILNLPLLPLFALILRIPMKILMPLVSLICIIGTYSLSNELMDVWIMLIMGMIGFAMRLFAFQAPPLILGMVFGPLMEKSFGQSTIMFQDHLLRFLGRPVTCMFFGIALLVLGINVFLNLCRYRSRSATPLAKGEGKAV